MSEYTLHSIVKSMLMLTLLMSFLSPELLIASVEKNKDSKAGTKEFVIRTDPEGARIYRIYENNERVLVGFSGRAVSVNLKSLDDKSILKFTLKKDGYLEEGITIEGKDIRANPCFPPPEEPPFRFPSPLRKIVFRTDPPGARVFLTKFGGGGGREHLGISDSIERPITLNLAEFAPGQEAGFVFSFEGYNEGKLSMEPHSFRTVSDRIIFVPPKGALPIELLPGTAGKVCSQFLRKNSLTLTLLAFTLIPAGLLFGWQRIRTRRDHEKLQRWETLTEHVDRGDPMFNRRVGNFVVVEKIGEGGMATVYRALPMATLSKEEAVAVKIIKVKKSEEEEYFRRFRREVRILRNLNHPNILKVIDYGDEGEVLYLITECIAGKTLEESIPAKGFSIPEFWELFKPILKAIEFAHSREILHRDIKAENIMVTEEKRVIVMDFGLAKGDQYSAITVAGNILGTPAYMAPEITRHKNVDSRADQYALGILAYKMLSGRLPFYDENPFNIIHYHLTEDPPSICENRPDLPKEFEKIVLKMIEKEPADRFESITGIIKALESAVRGSESRDETGQQ